MRALAIGSGGDEELHEFFGVPSLFPVGDGEPVEEFGVARLLSLEAEVLGGFDEAGAEDLLPEAVHGDAGEEGMIRVEEPVGEAEAVIG